MAELNGKPDFAQYGTTLGTSKRKLNDYPKAIHRQKFIDGVSRAENRLLAASVIQGSLRRTNDLFCVGGRLGVNVGGGGAVTHAHRWATAELDLHLVGDHPLPHWPCYVVP